MRGLTFTHTGTRADIADAFWCHYRCLLMPSSAVSYWKFQKLKPHLTTEAMKKSLVAAIIAVVDNSTVQTLSALQVYTTIIHQSICTGALLSCHSAHVTQRPSFRWCCSRQCLNTMKACLNCITCMASLFHRMASADGSQRIFITDRNRRTLAISIIKCWTSGIYVLIY